jgi:hypothetical protein
VHICQLVRHAFCKGDPGRINKIFTQVGVFALRRYGYPMRSAAMMVRSAYMRSHPTFLPFVADYLERPAFFGSPDQCVSLRLTK